MCCLHLPSYAADVVESSQYQNAELAVEDVPQALQDVSTYIERLKRKIKVMKQAIGYLKEDMDWDKIKIALTDEGYKRQEISPLLNLSVSDLNQKLGKELKQLLDIAQARIKATANVPPAATGKKLSRLLTFTLLV